MSTDNEIKAAAERRRIYLEGPRCNNKSCGSDPLHDLVILADAYLATCRTDDDEPVETNDWKDLFGFSFSGHFWTRRIGPLGYCYVVNGELHSPLSVVFSSPTRGQVRRLLEALQIGGGK